MFYCLNVRFELGDQVILSFLKRRKNLEEHMEDAHVETLTIFSDLKIIEALASLHLQVLNGRASPDECNDLLLGAYRTLYLAASVGRCRLMRKINDENAGNKVAQAIMTDSGIFNIVQMIRTSIPHTGMEQNQIIFNEIGVIVSVARIFEEMVTKERYDEAFEVWRVCAKGSYVELKNAGLL